MKRTGIIIGAIVLLMAVGLQGLKLRNAERGAEGGGRAAGALASALPQTVEGWTGRDEPLGPNESVRSAVEKTLNYDDYVYRTFERGGANFSVYVAYWGAGRMPLQKVASHTPDRCWTENGWTCPQQRFGVTLHAGGNALKPAQWRYFIPPGGKAGAQYVLYWHLVGDDLYDYGERFNARPDVVKWWRDTLRYTFSGSSEQHFIRLTSERPFEDLHGDPGFDQILQSLAALGLARGR